jgi:hypothetical protein
VQREVFPPGSPFSLADSSFLPSEFPHQDERPNGKVGTLVADRLKMLNQNRVVDPVVKRYSRKLPARIALSASLSDTARLYRTLASLSTASSASSSATTLPHAIVPPSPINLHSQAIGTSHPMPPPHVPDNRDFHRHETHGTVISH